MSVSCGRCEGKAFVVVGAPLCVVLRIKDSDGRAFEQDAALGAVTAVRVLFAGVVQQLLGGKSREPSLPVAPLEPARNKKDGERNNLRRADQLLPHAPPVPDPRMGFRKRAQAHVSSCPRCNLQTQCSESHIEAFLSAPAPCPPFFISHPDNTIASSLPVADAPSRLVVRLISDCCLVGISAHEPGLWAAVRPVPKHPRCDSTQGPHRRRRAIRTHSVAALRFLAQPPRPPPPFLRWRPFWS